MSLDDQSQHPAEAEATEQAKPLFDLNLYHDAGIAGSGAVKLRDSAVAPLVAAARGYFAILDPTLSDSLANEFKTVCRRIGVSDHASNKRHKFLRSAATPRDCLVIPLYSVHALAAYHHERYIGSETASIVLSTVQLRPAQPDPDVVTGKSRKYLFIPGTKTPLDIHPSTPRSWLTNPSGLVISEGTIKTDSALTAMLRHAGIADSDLHAPEALDDGTPNTDEARRVLSELMEHVPEQKRLMLVSIAGVTNWHRHSDDWSSFVSFDGLDVYIAFDGDLNLNQMVWKQAHQMWQYLDRQGALPHVIDLTIRGGSEGDDAKIGIDDYLSRHGTWGGVIARSTDTLPHVATEHFDGDWRIDDQLCVAERYTVVKGEGRTDAAWEELVPIAGRVESFVKERSVTIDEVRSGLVDVTAPGDERATLELRWIDRGHAAPTVAAVEGPAKVILTEHPDYWHRNHEVDLRGELVLNSAWPIGKHGIDWLKAIKGHRNDEIDRAVRWNHMGWVPNTSQGLSPVFVVGRQVVGPDGFVEDDSQAIPGVDDNVLSGADKFGVDLPDNIEQARDELNRVVTALQGAWDTSRSQKAKFIPAIALATMIRPAIPVQGHTPVVFVGQRRSGKSWSASLAMAGWQSVPGTFTESSLPGSAEDTLAAMEHAVSKTPIWVIDDLSASEDSRRAESKSDAVGQILRAVHNQAMKRRMQRDLRSREQNSARAELIVTAENEFSVASIVDRAVTVNLRAGSLVDGPKRELDRMRDHTGEFARVTGGIIRWIAKTMSEEGVENVISFWREMVTELGRSAAEITGLTGEAERHHGMAADLMLALFAAKTYASTELGDPELSARIAGMMDDIARFMHAHHVDQAQHGRAPRLVQALRSVLESGQGHMIGTSESGLPISAMDDSNATTLNRRLGWDIVGEQPSRPKGPRLGEVISKDGEHWALFEYQSAFNVAQRHHRDLIPSGEKPNVGWAALWDEGLIGDDCPWRQKQTTSGENRPVVRVSIYGSQVERVPIKLSALWPTDGTQDREARPEGDQGEPVPELF